MENRMSVETKAIITGADIASVKNFILMAFKGKATYYGSGGKNDAIITIDSLGRQISVMEHTWGKEEGNKAKNGDTYLKLGCYGTSKQILLFIASYFGGYYRPNDIEGDYVRIKPDRRKCIQMYFESWGPQE